MNNVVLSLGANLGDPAATLQAALDRLASYEGVRVVAVSPAYVTAPVGVTDQPEFLNAVAVVETVLEPRELIELTQHVERVLGRQPGERWGPRAIDIDIVAVDDVVSADPVVTLPHPRAGERAFVLVPWLDVEPDAFLPGVGPVAKRLEELDTSGVRRDDGIVLRVPDGRRTP